jgi:transposase-like protein
MTEEEENDQRPGETEEDMKTRKRKERLEQNRISARESRKRKKTMIEELQRTVITLSKENKELNERNEQLRRQLMEIGAKVRSFEMKPKLIAFCLVISCIRRLVTCRSCTDGDVEAKKCRPSQAATDCFLHALSFFCIFLVSLFLILHSLTMTHPTSPLSISTVP